MLGEHYWSLCWVTLSVPTLYNGQTHSKSTATDKLFDCGWTFCGTGILRVNIRYKNSSRGVLRNSLFKSLGKFQGKHMRQSAIFVTFQAKNGQLNGTNLLNHFDLFILWTNKIPGNLLHAFFHPTETLHVKLLFGESEN